MMYETPKGKPISRFVGILKSPRLNQREAEVEEKELLNSLGIPTI